ncbi:flexible cuticle protein 12-like [Prorops nasuta]|uniref:flexible cuticle protein 12-like n=1 Tax=Prorops nasuta TaxID=863751 RepID=UPI0034CD8ED4
MKMMIVLFALVAAAVAAPAAHEEQPVVLVKETPSDNIGVDGYNFGYELSNGESRQESAQLKNAGSENEALVVTGSYSFVDPATNVRYTVHYTADENGFHPQGDHIPA